MPKLDNRAMTPEVRRVYDSAFLSAYAYENAVAAQMPDVELHGLMVELRQIARTLHDLMTPPYSLDELVENLCEDARNDQGVEPTMMSFEEIMAMCAEPLEDIPQPTFIPGGEGQMSVETFRSLFESGIKLPRAIMVRNVASDIDGAMAGLNHRMAKLNELRDVLRGAREGDVVVISDFTAPSLNFPDSGQSYNAAISGIMASWATLRQDQSGRLGDKTEVPSMLTGEDAAILRENMRTLSEYTTLMAMLDTEFSGQCTLIIPYPHAVIPMIQNRVIDFGRIAG